MYRDIAFYLERLGRVADVATIFQVRLGVMNPPGYKNYDRNLGWSVLVFEWTTASPRGSSQVRRESILLGGGGVFKKIKKKGGFPQCNSSVR